MVVHQPFAATGWEYAARTACKHHNGVVPCQGRDQLSGWFLPADHATTAVVLLHGHGGNRRQMIARARLLYEAGYATLLYDARGDGCSEGGLVSAGWYETADLLGALDFLRAKGFQRFGCIGASQGGATILLAADQLPPEMRWCIVEAAYPTMRNALDRRFRRVFGTPGWLGGMLLVPFAEHRLGVSIDDIAPINHIGRLRCPVFILGGMNDQNTLPESTRALFEAARAPKELWIVPGAAHVDLYGFAQREYEKRILTFIAKAEAPHP